ncbi:MAG: HlyC/CorC family transporter [Endomicrobiales bacterium]|nr:HlyC/CorC family transporter [Endomicrobiales bacterium]
MFIISGSIIIIFLFALSAFWSGSETALTSLSKYKIKKIIALKKSLSDPLMQWLRFPYYLLTTILVGNTITNIVLSSFATILVLHTFPDFEIFPKHFGSLKFSLGRGFLEFSVWLITTFILIIFGEVTPKIFSRNNPEKITIFSLPLLTKITNIFGFLIWPINKLIKAIFPRIDIVPVGRLTYLNLNEIHELITEANDSGMLHKETGQMLERVLKLGELDVRKIMTPVDKIEAVNLNQDEDKLLDLLIETGHSRVPLYHDNVNKIMGFIHTKDLLWAWKNNQGHFSHDLVRAPYIVKQDKKIYDLMKEFQSGQTHIAFVTDGLGNITGLVTLEDVLEEIVGEILDEYDLEKEPKK